MATKPTVKMRVVLGQADSDDWPFVLGGVDQTTYEVIGEDDWRKLVERWKQGFDSAVFSYEWREATVVLPADKLLAVFEPKAIAAEVES